jgi:polysaccharide biosynthesis/export protein
MSRRHVLKMLIGSLALTACAARPYAPELAVEIHSEPYRLAAGDRLRIIVFGQDNLSNVYAIDGSGRISMPLIGAVDAFGKTTPDLARSIEGRLRAGYLREPKVSVEVDAYRPFFILGEVNSSGQFPYVSGMSVQTAVAIAGGFAPRANRTYAELSRQVNGQIVTGTVPMTHPILPGDTLVIRERWF